MCEGYKIFTRTFVIFSMFLTDLRRSSSSRKVAMLRVCTDAVVAVGSAEAVRRTARVKNDMGGYFEDIPKDISEDIIGQLRTSLPTLADIISISFQVAEPHFHYHHGRRTAI